MDMIIQTDNGKAVREISSASVPAYLTALANRPEKMGQERRTTLMDAAKWLNLARKRGYVASHDGPITHANLPEYMRAAVSRDHFGHYARLQDGAEIVEKIPALEGEF